MEFEWLQVSRTLLSILAILSNAAVWMVSTRPLISKSSSSYIAPLVTALRVSITIGITVNYIFHSFFDFLAIPSYLSFFSGTAKSTIRQLLFFCCCWFLLGLVVWSRLSDPFVSRNPREVCASHSSGQILVCALYHLSTWSNNFNLLRNSLGITFPTQSCLVLRSFCACLLDSAPSAGAVEYADYSSVEVRPINETIGWPWEAIRNASRQDPGRPWSDSRSYHMTYNIPLWLFLG